MFCKLDNRLEQQVRLELAPTGPVDYVLIRILNFTETAHLLAPVSFNVSALSCEISPGIILSAYSLNLDGNIHPHSFPSYPCIMSLKNK